MKTITVIFYLFSGFNLIGQLDSTDVFVVGGSDDDTLETTEVKMINERTTFKFDASKAYMVQSLFSVEHLLSNNKSSIEPELVFLLEPLDFVFDYYTKNRVLHENDTLTKYYPSINFQFGGGFGYKSYFDKKRNGLLGNYIGIKLRTRFGTINQKVITSNIFGSNAVEKDGYISISELSLVYGHSFWIRNLVQIDPFIGPSIAFSRFKYAVFNDDILIPNWESRKATTILPSIHFGVRIGFPSSMGVFLWNMI